MEFKISTPSDAMEAQYSTYQIAEVNRGATVDKPADPKPEDYDLSPEEYEFIGWFTDSSLTHVYNFEEKVEKDTALYVGWHKKEQKGEIRITFDANVPVCLLVHKTKPGGYG